MKQMKQAILLFVLTCLTCGGVQAQVQVQALNRVQLDSLFDRLSRMTPASGSIAVGRGRSQQGEVYTRAFGNRYVSPDQRIEIPNDEQTCINIGSITKMFVATLVFQLIDEQRLALDDTLSRWFPELPNADRITIRQMLGHRSGLENYMDNPAFQMTYPLARSREELLEVLRLGTPAFEPGQGVAYSNAGYVLLRMIVEQITERSFEQALRVRIWEPAGIVHAAVQPDKTDASSRNIAQSYLPLEGRRVPWPETQVGNVLGAGGLTMAPQDLIRFARALFGGQLVSGQSLEQMMTLHEDSPFGLGLTRMPYNDHRGWGHTGGIDAYRSALVYYPDEDVFFAGCFNTLEMGRDQVSPWVLAIAFDEPFELPSFEAVRVDRALLEGYVGVYTSGEFPLAITIRETEGKLSGQATGQGPFPLETVDEKRFRNASFGILIEFDGAGGMQLTQGRTYRFVKNE